MWLAHATLRNPTRGMRVDYDRVERTSTATIMDVHFGQDAIAGGMVRLFINDTLVKHLGTQRVAPEPQSSVIGNGGITYTFPVSGAPAEVQFAMEPGFPGVHRFTMQVPGKQAVSARIVVVP